MKIIQKYVDEITGKEYHTTESAQAAENYTTAVKEAFAAWERIDDIDFANGKYSVQRSKAFYMETLKTIELLLRNYHPKIIKDIEKRTVWKPEFVFCYLVQRTLDDMGDYLCRYVYRAERICPVCYKEWGQLYYKNHCVHLFLEGKQ